MAKFQSRQPNPFKRFGFEPASNYYEDEEGNKTKEDFGPLDQEETRWAYGGGTTYHDKLKNSF